MCFTRCFEYVHYVSQKRGPEQTLKTEPKTTENMGPETLKMELLLRQRDGLRKNTCVRKKETYWFGALF